MRSLTTRYLTAGAVLLALSLAIPLAFGGFLSIIIGPFSATLGSHVPVLLSCLYGPVIGALVGGGSALGFFLKLGPVIGARAAMHVPVAVVGSWLLSRRLSYPLVLAVLAPLHAALETIIVAIAFGRRDMAAIVAGGTVIHHALDSLIAVICWRTLNLKGPSRAHS